MNDILVSIMCGGHGTRLWPMSRSNYPKQFLNIANDNLSLLQEAIIGSDNISENKLLIGNADKRFLISDQLNKINKLDSIDIILEPFGRNTLAVCIISALHAIEQKLNYVLMLPSDHSLNYKILGDILRENFKYFDNNITTFGIKPDLPSTDYGYIKSGTNIHNNIFQVSKFIEKPNIENAKRYIKHRDINFNSGIFILPVKLFIDEVKRISPKNYEFCLKAYQNIYKIGDYDILDAEHFGKVENISIDHAIMEKTKKIIILKSDKLSWSDFGSYGSVYKIKPKDENQNVKMGDNITLDQTSSSFIINKSLKTDIITSNIEDLLIYLDDDKLFISKNSKINFNFKNFIQNNQNFNLHNFDYRPWGKYENILESEAFKIKRITILPQKSISLQVHNKRCEHWVIVSGSCKVIIGKDTLYRKANDSIFIPKGVMHKITNESHNKDLIFIEVQYGEYLGEDDILRISDEWDRECIKMSA